MIVRAALLVALALLASSPRAAAADDGAKPDPARAAQEAEARRKLDAVRAEIKALVAQQRATEG